MQKVNPKKCVQVVRDIFHFFKKKAFHFQEPKKLLHPTRDVLCVGLCSQQSIIASGLEDGRIFLWEMSSGQFLKELVGGHRDKVTGVSFNRDATIMISVGQEGAMNLWDLTDLNRVLRRKLVGHDGASLTCCQVSPNSCLIATGGKDCDVMVWGNVGRPVCGRLRGHSNWVASVAFDPNSNVLASGGYDCAVCLWNCLTFTLIRTIRHHESPVKCVAFSADASLIGSGDTEGKVLVMRVSDGACLRSLHGHVEEVTGIAFLEGAGAIVSVSLDSSLKVWALRGRCLNSFRAHDGGCLAVFVSPQDSVMVTCGDDYCANIFPFGFDDKDAVE